MWWFLPVCSADLKFHPTYQISVKLNLIFKGIFIFNLEIFFMKYGTISQENNNLFIHIALLSIGKLEVLEV
jgi:hypothetical protein